MAQELEVHPAAARFPSLQEVDPSGYAAMVRDMKENGYNGPPVTLCEGKILDGRNRYEAWIDSGGNGELKTRQYKGKGDPDDLFQYAYRENCQRRHLTGLQKGLLFITGFDRDRSNPGMTERDLANTAGVSKEAAALSLNVFKYLPPDAVEECIRGTMSATEAEREVKSNEVSTTKAERQANYNRQKFQDMVEKVADGAIYTRDSLGKAWQIRSENVQWVIMTCDVSPDVTINRTYGKRQLAQFQFVLEQKEQGEL